MVTRQIKQHLDNPDVDYIELYFSSGNSVIVKEINDNESTEECLYVTKPVTIVINLEKVLYFQLHEIQNTKP